MNSISFPTIWHHVALSEKGKASPQCHNAIDFWNTKKKQLISFWLQHINGDKIISQLQRQIWLNTSEFKHTSYANRKKCASIFQMPQNIWRKSIYKMFYKEKPKSSTRNEGAMLSVIHPHSAKYFKLFFKQTDEQLRTVKASVCTDIVLAQV